MLSGTDDIDENSLGHMVKTEKCSVDLAVKTAAWPHTRKPRQMQNHRGWHGADHAGGVRAALDSLGTLNITAGADFTHSTTGAAQETVGKDHTSKATGKR